MNMAYFICVSDVTNGSISDSRTILYLTAIWSLLKPSNLKHIFLKQTTSDENHLLMEIVYQDVEIEGVGLRGGEGGGGGKWKNYAVNILG